MAISNEQLLAAIKKNPIVTACIVVALAAVAGLYFRADLVPQATTDLEDLTKKSRRMAANIKNAARLDEHLAAVTEANAVIDKRLVVASQLAVNLQYFYELEASTGIKFMDLRQVATQAPVRGQAKKQGAFEPVGFAVALNGTYPQLIEFLQRLEGGKHFCRVLTASFSPSYGEGGPVGLSRPEELTLTLTLELLGKASS